MQDISHVNLHNRWRIPLAMARQVATRDVKCVYCGSAFESRIGIRRGRASWEHIVNDLNLVNLENIALSCIGCNASKGTKSLLLWLSSSYCQSRGISKVTFSPVAAAALRHETIKVEAARLLQSQHLTTQAVASPRDA